MNTKGCDERNCPLQYNPERKCELTRAECPYYTSSIKTMYDLIRSFSIDDMAAFMAQLCHERDITLLEALHEQGIDATLVELPFEVQCEIHKKYLLSDLSDFKEEQSDE